MFGQVRAHAAEAETLLGRGRHSTRAPIVRHGRPLLELIEISTVASAGECALRDLSLALWSGEVLGVAGVDGKGQPNDQLVGGQGTLKEAAPIRTIGSYWPYATTVFDYVRRAMPYVTPHSLTPDETYALTAYLLALNGVIAQDAVMDAATLPKVVMPNRANFDSAYREPRRR